MNNPNAASPAQTQAPVTAEEITSAIDGLSTVSLFYGTKDMSWGPVTDAIALLERLKASTP